MFYAFAVGIRLTISLTCQACCCRKYGHLVVRGWVKELMADSRPDELPKHTKLAGGRHIYMNYDITSTLLLLH